MEEKKCHNQIATAKWKMSFADIDHRKAHATGVSGINVAGIGHEQAKLGNMGRRKTNSANVTWKM